MKHGEGSAQFIEMKILWIDLLIGVLGDTILPYIVNNLLMYKFQHEFFIFL